jgi:hypothetical protein
VLESTLGRTIEWAGYTWDVKSGSGLGPGPNDWSDSTDNVWIDAQTNLHLKITQDAVNPDKWYCAEVSTTGSLSYGEYRVLVDGPVHDLDSNAVGGLFTYLDDLNELDIEFVKAWTGTNNANFVTQPPKEGNYTHFFIPEEMTASTHRIAWHSQSLYFESASCWCATGDPTPAAILRCWSYTNSDIPVASSEKFYLNLWLFKGRAPAGDGDLELVLRDFRFVAGTNTNTVVKSRFALSDDFEDESMDATLWDFFGAAYLQEQWGVLRVKGSPPHMDQVGVISSDALQWTNVDAACRFSCRLNDILTPESNSVCAVDIQGIIGALCNATVPWFATNAALLFFDYTTSNDMLALSFNTKTSGSGNGIPLFTGVLHEVSTYLAGNAFLDLGFKLDADHFEVTAFNDEGMPINLSGQPANGAGTHPFGAAFTTAYWFVGGRAMGTNWCCIDYESTCVEPGRAVIQTNALPPSRGYIACVGQDKYPIRDPINTYWEQARQESIYLADDIGAAGTIHALALHICEAPDIVLSNFTIRMQHTDEDGDVHFIMTCWHDLGWTTVFQEDVTIPSNGWFTFEFTNFFHYNGTGNLLVDFSKDNDDVGQLGYCYCSTGYALTTQKQFIDDTVSPLDTNVWHGQQPCRARLYLVKPSRYYPNIRLYFRDEQEDLDGDTIHDWWEYRWFGGIHQASAATDYDQDGFFDCAEALEGSDPLDAHSLLQLSITGMAGHSLVFQWQSHTNRRYSLERASHLTGTGSFTAVVSNLPPAMNCYTDAPADHAQQFYRIRSTD